jgi:hypothetical protein
MPFRRNGVRVDAEHADRRPGDADAPAGRHHGLRRRDDKIGRQAAERGGHRFVQRDMGDAQALGHQHHEHFFARCFGDVGEQAGIAAERNAGAVDGRLRMRATDDGIDLAVARCPR